MQKLTLKIEYFDGSHGLLEQFFERQWVLDHALAELALFGFVSIVEIQTIGPIEVKVAEHAQDVLVALKEAIESHIEMSAAA